MAALPTPEAPGLPGAASRGVSARLVDLARAVVGPAEEDSQRQDVIRRALITAAIIRDSRRLSRYALALP